MKRVIPFVFLAAVLLYLPTVRYGFVQDDRAIIVSNPAAHSVTAALRGFGNPYWPRESGAGLYRPITILSYALDWTVSGGRPGWLHLMNALWHGLVTVLLTVLLARWLPAAAAAAAGLVFAWHPVHVEAVASLVGRAELLAAAGIFGAVLAARRSRWILALACAAIAMLSKEHGVIVGVVILLDRWLEGGEGRPYPKGFWIALAALTVGYLIAWFAIGWVGASDQASVFYGRGATARLLLALPAIVRAAALLVWPASLSADYSPQVLPVHDGLSLPALLGTVVVVSIPVLVWLCRRSAPAMSFAIGLAGLSYLPTANLLFPAGVVLAERNLYLAVAVPAALVGLAVAWLASRPGLRPTVETVAAVSAVSAVLLACGARSVDRLPAWRDNRSQLLTLLAEHPESYRAHASAASVLAGIGDTVGARSEYRIADSLFSGDPYLDAARAIFLLGLHDTTAAVPLLQRARASGTADRTGLRAQFLLELERGNRTAAATVADSATRRYPGDEDWYLNYLR